MNTNSPWQSKRILIVGLGLLLLVFFIQNLSYTTCTYCGERIAKKATYCSECGKSFSEIQEQSADYTILDSGICNSNVSWEIRSDGTLYIFGNGTIPNYENFEVDGEIAPWRASAVCSEITDVIISDGITGVGKYAFFRLSLSSIKFGHDVITYNFEGDFHVETAYIPSSMKDIYDFLSDCDYKALMTIYYEGTEDEWEAISESNTYESYLFAKYCDCDIYYNYEY